MVLSSLEERAASQVTTVTSPCSIKSKILRVSDLWGLTILIPIANTWGREKKELGRKIQRPTHERAQTNECYKPKDDGGMGC